MHSALNPGSLDLGFRFILIVVYGRMNEHSQRALIYFVVFVKVDSSPLKLNKWARLTELGMSPNAYKVTMVNEDTRVRFTPSPFGQGRGVLGGWLNISIKLDQFDDFLK